jgi:GrpB-like predicted nucleotidyltransferase (UPF0157 family)
MEVYMDIFDSNVKLEKYNSIWEEDFLKECEIIKKLAGKYVLKIEHVGSTSIKGLSAKPIIDIVILVEKLSDALKFSKVLETNGYSFRYDNGKKGEYFVYKKYGNERVYYIHIVEKESSRYENFILFKNYLISHKDKMKEYQALKEQLSKKYKSDRKHYTLLKANFIENIIKLAKKKQ